MPIPAPAIPALVTTTWLSDHLGMDGLLLFDASWHMPDKHRDAKAEYQAAHIPGAVRFDIDAIAAPGSTLPHTMPEAEDFAAMVGALGMTNDKTVVVYDAAGLFSAPRAAWMLRAMGHDAVGVLDGGLPKWLAENRPVEQTMPAPHPAQFTPHPRPALIRNLAQMRDNLHSKAEQVLDARGAARFTAAEPEPRPGMRCGHIPGSKNVHYQRLLRADDTLRDAAELKTLFEAEKVDLTAPIVTSCGSGVTAAILLLALNRAGADKVALYDGSWSEWGSRSDTPVDV